jgi:hypothetical protein
MCFKREVTLTFPSAKASEGGKYNAWLLASHTKFFRIPHQLNPTKALSISAPALVHLLDKAETTGISTLCTHLWPAYLT